MDEADSISEPEATSINVSPNISISYIEWMNSGKYKEEIEKFFLEADWITEELWSNTDVSSIKEKNNIDSSTFQS